MCEAKMQIKTKNINISFWSRLASKKDWDCKLMHMNQNKNTWGVRWLYFVSVFCLSSVSAKGRREEKNELHSPKLTNYWWKASGSTGSFSRHFRDEYSDWDGEFKFCGNARNSIYWGFAMAGLCNNISQQELEYRSWMLIELTVIVITLLILARYQCIVKY